MQGELSTNWKKLQARIQSESARQPSRKRKPGDQPALTLRKRSRRQSCKSEDTNNPTSAPNNRTSGMGVTQSSRIEVAAPDTKTPASLALWSDTSDATPEHLAEAYRLGLRDNALLNLEKERVNEGRAEVSELGK